MRSKVVPAGVPWVLTAHKTTCVVMFRYRCEKTALGGHLLRPQGTYKASHSVDGERAQRCDVAAGCVWLGQVPARRRPWAFPEQGRDRWRPKAWRDRVSGYSTQREDVVSVLFP